MMTKINPCRLKILLMNPLCQTSLILSFSPPSFIYRTLHILIKGFISVALGAFGAHGLQKSVTDPRLIKVPLSVQKVDL